LTGRGEAYAYPSSVPPTAAPRGAIAAICASCSAVNWTFAEAKFSAIR